MISGDGNRSVRIIRMMRFPLIVLVVFIHMLGWNYVQISELDSLGPMSYHAVTELISHVIGNLAVPCFFFFSGYLFFLGLDGPLSWKWLKDKWRKRLFSVVIPYVVWILLTVVAYTIKNFLSVKIGLVEGGEMEEVRKGVLYWFVTPINYPLWYVRDLMAMILAAPLFHWLFRYTKAVGLVLLAVAFIIPYNYIFKTAILFFGAGSYFGMQQGEKGDFLSTFSAVRIPSYIASLVLMVICLWLNGRQPNEYVLPFFVIVGVIAAINIGNKMIDNPKVFDFCCKMEKYVFFIFAIHESTLKSPGWVGA